MLVPDITIYDALKGAIGEEKARQVVEGIRTKVSDEVETHKSVLATKEDISRLEKQILEAKVEIMRWMFGVFAMLILAIVGLYFKH